MKTKIKRHSRSVISVVLAVCMLVSCMTVGLIATYAASFRSSAIVYFDNSKTQWSNVYLIYGRQKNNDDWFYNTQLTNISGTDLFCCSPSTDWAGIDGNTLLFVDGADSDGERELPDGEGGFWRTARTDFDHYTTFKDMSLSESTSYLFVPTSGDNDTDFDNYASITAYSALNNTVTIKSMFSSNGSTYEESTGTKYGDFAVTGAKYISADKTGATPSLSQTNGQATISLARTNTASFSQTPVRGYTFMGWKTAKDETGSGLTSDTISFTNEGNDATIYAYYKRGSYNGITASVSPVGAGTVTPTTTVDNVSAESGTSVTATAGTHYVFDHWSSSNGTFLDSSNASTTFKPTADNAVADANFVEKEHNVVFSVTTDSVADPAGGSISPSGTQAVKEVTATTVNATANAGYQCTGFTVGTGVTVNSSAANGDNYTASIITNSTTSAVYTVQANFVKKDYTVTKGSTTGSGTFTVSPTTAQIGDTVTVGCNPETGWMVSSVTFGADGTGHTASISGNDATFTMLPENTVVNVTFTKINYGISKSVDPDGTSCSVEVQKSEIDVATYNIGDSLTLVATPDATHKFVSFTVTGYESSDVTYTDNNHVLDMTGKTGALTVVANFENKNVVAAPVLKLNGDTSTVVANASDSITATIYNYDAIKDYCNSFTLRRSANSDMSDSTNVGTFENGTLTFTPDASTASVDGATTYYYDIHAALNNEQYVANCFAAGAQTADSSTVSTGLFKPTYSLVGNISSDYLVGSALDEATQAANNTAQWQTRYAAYDISQATATPGVYTITIEVKEDIGAHNTIHIGLYDFVDGDHAQVGFYVSAGSQNDGEQAYDEAYEDFVIPEGGISAFPIIQKNAVDSGAGTFVLEKGRKYKFTIDQTAAVAGVTGEITGNVSIELLNAKVKVNAKMKTFNPTAGTWNAAVDAPDSIGTVSASSYKGDKTFEPTLTAKIVNGNYDFDGWYTDLSGSAVDTHTSYTPSLNASAEYYALFKEKTPASYVITPATDVTGATVGSGVTNTIQSGCNAAGGKAYAGATVVFEAGGIDDADKVMGWYVNDILQSGTKGKTTFTLKNVNANTTVTVKVAKKTAEKINVVSNNTDLGTATATKIEDGNPVAATTAIEDTAITIHAVPGSEGMLTGITVTGVETGTDYSSTISPSAFDKDGGDYEFTMPAEEVTVAVFFDDYSGLSSYYLDGYKHSSSDTFEIVSPASRQLSTAKLGSVYSYYKVPSNAHFYGYQNSDVVSLFAIKDSIDAARGIPGKTTGRIYFATPPSSWNDNQGWVSQTPQVCFYANADGTSVLGNSYPGYQMSSYTTTSNLDVYGSNTTCKWYYLDIPAAVAGAKSFVINNNRAKTNVISGNDMSVGCYKLTNNENVANYQSMSGKWNDQGVSSTAAVAPVDNYYDYDATIYKTATFEAHILPVVKTIKNYHLDKEDYEIPYVDKSESESYYVIVLHPNKTYTLTRDGQTYTYSTGAKPEVYASKYLPGEEPPLEPVDTVYAKDGAVRNGFQRFAEYAETYITNITGPDGTVYVDSTSDSGETYGTDHARSGKDGNVDWDQISNIPFGSTITWTTTLGDGNFNGDGTSAFKDTHYVRGFSVNGVTEEVFDWRSDGVYTGTHVVNTIDCRRGHIEITPIYWLKNATYTKTFYVEGFDRDDAQFRTLGWGDELGVYPYYENKTNAENGFGGYPGQPMLFYKGTYVMQIPTTVNGLPDGAKVKGLTLSNNYWDLLHRQINGSDIYYPVNHHRQTYDYDDFFEIASEKKPLTITLSYRLRSVNDNFGDGAETRDQLTPSKASATVSLSAYQNTYNGTEEYLDSLNRPIDLFGNVLNASQAAQTPLLVISNGYKNTYVGKYATEWAVYKQQSGDTYEYITSISPSALVVNSSGNLKNYNATAYATPYTTLESYKGKPVLISFEKSQENTTGDVADRLDARWYYTKTSDQVEANIVIQYDNNDGLGYVDDTFTAPSGDDRNLGVNTQARAYFTNITPNDIYGDVKSGKTQLTAQTQYFNLKAEESTNYQFVGWYSIQDGKYIPMEQDEGVTETHTIIKKTETYYARYKKITSGTVSIKHVIQNGNYDGTNYNGSGTPYLSVQILNTDDQVVANFPKATGSVFTHSKYIRSIYADYKVKVTIETTPESENTFRTYAFSFVNAEGVPTPRSTSDTFFGTPTSGSKTSSAACVFEFKVGDLFNEALTVQEITGLEYYSRLTKVEYTFNYEINYTFKSRIWNDQTYRVEGTISNDRISTFIDMDPSDKTLSTLKAKMIEDLTPYESNYMKVIRWNYAAATQECVAVPGKTNTYKITANVGSTQDDNTIVHAEFKLPYEYDYDEALDEYTPKQLDFYDKETVYDTKYDSYTQEQYEAAYKTDLGQDVVPAIDQYGTTHFDTTDGSKKTSFVTDTHTDTHGVGYDDSVASFTLISEEGHQFNTDNQVHDNKDDMKLVTAPDFVFKSSDGGNITYHSYKVPCYYYSYDQVQTGIDEDDNPIYDVKGYQYGGKEFHDGIVYNNDHNVVKKYFTRWDVIVDGQTIASCYSKQFNIVTYQDVIVVPVFDSDQPSGNSTAVTTQEAKANVTFLGTTRNQWNVKGEGVSRVTVTKGGQTYDLSAADRLFTDFDLEYAYNDMIFEDVDGTVKGNTRVEVGFVIQQLGDLVQVGDGFDTSAATYADMYKNQYNVDNLTAWINAGTAKADGFTTIKKKIGDNFTTGNDAIRLDKTDSLISNRNALEYYYYFTKSRTRDGQEPELYYSDHHKAYRAFTYIKYSTDDGKTWNTKISDSPAYFTTYDEAVRTKY